MKRTPKPARDAFAQAVQAAKVLRASKERDCGRLLHRYELRWLLLIALPELYPGREPELVRALAQELVDELQRQDAPG